VNTIESWVKTLERRSTWISYSKCLFPIFWRHFISSSEATKAIIEINAVLIGLCGLMFVQLISKNEKTTKKVDDLVQRGVGESIPFEKNSLTKKMIDDTNHHTHNLRNKMFYVFGLYITSLISALSLLSLQSSNITSNEITKTITFYLSIVTLTMGIIFTARLLDTTMKHQLIPYPNQENSQYRVIVFSFQLHFH
jgi:hypothetical protein